MLGTVERCAVKNCKIIPSEFRKGDYYCKEHARSL